ncbi:MAG: hypothetical protein ACKVOE_06380 [Rickettsiales bacterium]
MNQETTIRDKLAAAFPDEDMNALVHGCVAESPALPKPVADAVVANSYQRAEWAPEDFVPVVQVDKTCHAGAFAWGYFADPERIDPITRRRGEIMVVLSRRGKEKAADGEPLYAATGGGYRELGSNHTAGEQPDENAAREMREETVNDEKQPILDIDPARLADVLKVGTDYRRPQMPVDYVGYALALNAEEYRAIAAHGERMRTDAAYKAAVFKHTKAEVAGYDVMPLSQALQLQPDQFAHPHEQEALLRLAKQLDRQTAASPTRT